MSYFIYQLKFTTPVHFGNAEQGGHLEQAGLAFAADNLFGALCCELNTLQENEYLQKLVEKVQQRKMLFSDLFPFRCLENKGGDMYFYLPKPVITAVKTTSKNLSYQDTKQLKTKYKSAKKMSYIRASELVPFLRGECMPNADSFGEFSLAEKINCRGEEALPYYVGSFTFDAECGLYGILYVEDEADKDWLFKAFEALGHTGMGGKRSSGYGKFEFVDDEYDVSEGFYQDDTVIAEMLQHTAAPYQMCLSTTIPTQADITVLQDEKSSYKLLKRSGFVSVENDVEMSKKNSIYALAAGSCLYKPILGDVAVLGTSNQHPVLRYGLGMYAGIEL